MPVTPVFSNAKKALTSLEINLFSLIKTIGIFCRSLKLLDKAILTNMSLCSRINYAAGAVNARPFTDCAWHCELKEAMAVWISKDY